MKPLGKIMPESKLEAEMARQLKLAKIPFLRETPSIIGRRFKFDFQVRDLLIEVNGGTSQRPVKINGKWYILASGHNSMAGTSRDAEKQNLACLAGYHTMAFTKEHIASGQALKWVQEYLK
jgi:hypothetical protein